MKDYGFTATVLTELLRKSLPEVLPWEERHQQAFQKLKNQLASDTVLATPDHSKTFSLHTDASYVGIGAVLTQLDELDQERPIAYYSRKLLEREKKYSATEVELLGVVEAAKHFSVYLLGQPFKLLTDHKALIHLQTMRNTNSRLTRWSLALQPFSFDVIHKPGANNTNADGLSRQAWPDIT